MDKFSCNSVFRTMGIMPVSKDKHDSFRKEIGNKQTKDEEISFGEVLDKAMKNCK